MGAPQVPAPPFSSFSFVYKERAWETNSGALSLLKAL